MTFADLAPLERLCWMGVCWCVSWLIYYFWSIFEVTLKPTLYDRAEFIVRNADLFIE